MGNLGAWLDQSDGQNHFKGRIVFSHLLGGGGLLPPSIHCRKRRKGKNYREVGHAVKPH